MSRYSNDPGEYPWPAEYVPQQSAARVAAPTEQRATEARCAESSGSLPALCSDELIEKLWDAIRLECCSTGTKAHRVVLLHKHDLTRAVARIKAENTEVVATAVEDATSN